MYFTKVSKTLGEAFRPTVVKLSSTTEALRSALADFIDGRSISSAFALPSERAQSGTRLIAAAGLKRLNDLAITGAGFSNVKGAAKEYLPDLRRLISILYTKHYLGFAGADIISGIGGLAVFDGLSGHFPLYDFSVWRRMLEAFGADQNIKDGQQQLNRIESFLMIRGGEYHQRFLKSARLLLVGLLSKNRGVFPSAARETTRQQLLQSLDAIRWPKFSLDVQRWQGWEKCAEYLDSIILDQRRDHLFEAGIVHYGRLNEARKPLVLLVIATETECRVLLDIARQTGLMPTPRRSSDVASYDLGELGGVQLVAIQCEMGSGGPAGSLLTVYSALMEMHPDAVIMPGIAFGCKEKEHNMGDILVARQIVPYELQKRTNKGNRQVILRGDRSSSDEALLGIARTVSQTWSSVKVHFGTVLSGEKLVNNRKFRNELIECVPEAIGGEMEGAGVWAACQRARVRWLLCKGICDWGYNKGDDHQHQAARNAVHFAFGLIQAGTLASRLIVSAEH